MPLLPRQEKYLEAIEWLIQDEPIDSAVGRTELLCHAFIRKAIATQRAVRPFDHHWPWSQPVHESVNFPERIRRTLLVDYPDYDMVWNTVNQSFTLHKRGN